MKTFWRSLITALKIVLFTVLIISVAGIGILGWYFYDTTFAETPSDNGVFRLLESLVPTRETQPTEPLISTLPTTQPTEPPTTEPPTTLPPEPEHVVSTATIGTVGDLLMHKPVFESCRQSDGSYDFESIFRYFKDTISSLDYAIANLETTFGGDGYVYQGNPAFNCPDALAGDVAEAGFDMLLTANNHSGDTMASGIIRTVEHVRESGLVALGSQLNGEEPKYQIIDVNGIRIGMVCYTWAYSGDGTKFSLNGLAAVQDEGQMNYFVNSNPDKLYREAEQIMAEMKANGAEATMMFIHWGVEYNTTENALQNAIAQRLCDMGFDVIVGGHPHVVQPVDLLTSTVDPDHKTVVIYSLGNAVSNQRTGISDLFPAGYTEDGVLFNVTFSKYSDGTVYLEDVDVIPTWVDLRTTNGRFYHILPLDASRMDDWKTLLDLTDGTLNSATRSYNRTMGIVGEGLEKAKQYLAEAKDLREANYLAAVVDMMYAA
ncbi:MAG: CapA family protein [Clostridiales bacterium]|nr:CapA family protein [Clostridiales bacterium]